MDRETWNRAIDNYCERIGPDFWAEPLNAVTNISFLIAGFYALSLARRMNRLDEPTLLLSLNAILVGIGSFLFHTFATRWAGLADVLPILLFILGYFATAMNRFVGLSWLWAGLATVLYLGVSFTLPGQISALTGGLLRGSVSYVPAFLAMLFIGLWMSFVRRHQVGAWLLAAAGIFALSLTFRTLDQPTCDRIPVGTHFLWHLFNGLLLGTLLVALIRHGRAPRARRAVA